MDKSVAPTHAHSHSQKPRLGRGLSSLVSATQALAADDRQYQHVTGLPPVATARQSGAQDASPQELTISAISPNPYQPRREFPPQDLQELAQSITQQGILQPLIVTVNDQPTAASRYTLVAGERRLRAAKLAGLATVPCIIRQASARQMLEWALIENIQRSDLNPLERAAAYRDYIDRFNLTAADAAERLGVPRTTVANYIRLLDLSPDIQGLIASCKLTFGHAKVLAGIVGNPQRQSELAARTVKEDLSVRALEGLVVATPAGAEQAPKPRQTRSKPPYVLDLQEQLTHAVGTRVTIVQGRSRNAGRIVIDFYSLEDFDRIAGSLGLKVQT